MREMTRSQAEAFRDRWNSVAAAWAEERRSASIQLRWEQMNALRRLAVGLELPLDPTDEQEETVWKRWSGLKGQLQRTLPSSLHPSWRLLPRCNACWGVSAIGEGSWAASPPANRQAQPGGGYRRSDPAVCREVARTDCPGGGSEGPG